MILQRESLQRQMELNEHEMEATKQELDLYFESGECDYQKFSENLHKKRREAAEKVAPAPTVDVVVGEQVKKFNKTKIMITDL